MSGITDADRERIRRLASGEEAPRVPYRRPRRISAHNAPCCRATRDEHGRICIGYCGDDCMRRP